MKKLYIVFTESQQDANLLCEHMAQKEQIAFPGCWRSGLTNSVQTVKNSILDTVWHFMCNAPQDAIVIGLNHTLFSALRADFPKEIEIHTFPAEAIQKI